jgi:acetolactate synthase I/II/III large subunit
MATVADRILERLGDTGVGHIFGVPGGGGNLDLIAAAGRAGIPFVLTATETGAAIAAIAQAEITGKPAVCLTTLGPGAASVVNGVACAHLDRAPLVVFTDSHPASAAACSHQRLDHRALLAPVTKWSATLTSDCAETTVSEALARATTAPAGPVHLDCPGDVLSADADRSAEDDRSAKAFALPETFALQEAFALQDGVRTLIRNARKPLLLVGLGARRPSDADAVRSLCETRRLPAMVTYKGKGVVPDDHEWFGGVFTNGAIERPLVDRADLLIAVGLDPVELIPRPWRFAAPIVSCAASTMDDRHVRFTAQLVGDIAAILAGVSDALNMSAWDSDVVHGAVAEQRRQASPPAVGLSALQVVHRAAARLARTARVTVDAGAHMFPATIGWPSYEPNQMLISNGLSTMGFALPAAIGAALLDRERPIVALTGDGGLLMCAGELATAVRERLHVITIVFADEALSLIEVKQRQRELPTDGVKLGHTEWRTLAEGFGARGFVARDEHELEQALELAAAYRGPSVIEARIDAGPFGPALKAIRG